MRISGNISGFKGSLYGFAEHYCTFGRKITPTYSIIDVNKDYRAITGRDHKENLLLTALRIASWMTVIFPILAKLVTVFMERPMPEMGGEDPFKHKVIGRMTEPFFNALLRSKVAGTTFPHLCAKTILEGDPNQLFHDNMEFSQLKSDQAKLGVVWGAVYASVESENDWRGNARGGLAMCRLSLTDERAAKFGKKFSPALIRVLQLPQPSSSVSE